MAATGRVPVIPMINMAEFILYFLQLTNGMNTRNKK